MIDYTKENQNPASNKICNDTILETTAKDCLTQYCKLEKNFLTKIPINLWDSVGFCLQEAVEKLFAIGGLSIHKIRKANLTVRSLEERMGEFARLDPIFDPETAEPYTLALQNKNLIKIKNDRAFLEKFLDRLANDIIQKNSYKILKVFIHDHAQFDKDAKRLILEEQHNAFHCCILELRRQNIHDRKLKEVQHLSDSVRKCETDSGLQLIQNEISSVFIQQYQRSLTENVLAKLSNIEKRIEEIIDKFKFQIEKELKVHFDIFSYLDQNKMDINSKMMYWRDKCDTEFERLQTDLYLMAEKIEEQQNKYELVSKEYQEHKKELEEYLMYEEQKRILAEQEAMYNINATKIQSWWRGLLVRLKLGPFNPKKGKKNKNKGSKKRRK